MGRRRRRGLGHRGVVAVDGERWSSHAFNLERRGDHSMAKWVSVELQWPAQAGDIWSTALIEFVLYTVVHQSSSHNRPKRSDFSTLTMFSFNLSLFVILVAVFCVEKSR